MGPGPAQQRGEASFNHTTAQKERGVAWEDKREVLLLKYSLYQGSRYTASSLQAPAPQPGANSVFSLDFSCSCPSRALGPNKVSQPVRFLLSPVCRGFGRDSGISRCSPLRAPGWPGTTVPPPSGGLRALAGIITLKPTGANGQSLHSPSKPEHTEQKFLNSNTHMREVWFGHSPGKTLCKLQLQS